LGRDRAARHGHNGYAQDFTTFFFSNFSSGYGEMDMVKIFQKWARVKEVFISRRFNKWGRRFGFVSFFGVRNFGRLEKELDQVYIGSRKLYVNIPKFKRDSCETGRMVRKAQRIPYQMEPRKLYQNAIESRGKQSCTEKWVEKTGKRSYAEAVVGHHQDQWKGPSVTTYFSIMPWMERSVVGKLRDEVDSDCLGEEIVKGGMNMFRVRPTGDNLVLLSPKDGENMKAIIKLNAEWFNSVFVSVTPWTVSSGSSHKLTWVRCYGLSLPLWNRDCFAKLIGLVALSAALISVDKATESWETLEYARFQVRMLKFDRARLAKCVQVNKQLCNILIEEEVPMLFEDSYKDINAFSDSSDSVSSSETYVEETNFSVAKGMEELCIWEGEDYCRSKGVKAGKEVEEKDEQCS